jgi:hypothetical protein
MPHSPRSATARQRAQERARKSAEDYRRMNRATPSQHKSNVQRGHSGEAKAPKRTPRLSEAEKREARRKRRERVRESGLPASRLNMTDAQINAEYQRLADDEVKRASEVVRATPRDTARRRTRSTTRHAPGRGL